MFTHLNVLEYNFITQLVKLYQALVQRATGVVQSISATKNTAAATSISVASPGVVTLNSTRILKMDNKY
jgi:hypothetical protein